MVEQKRKGQILAQLKLHKENSLIKIVKSLNLDVGPKKEDKRKNQPINAKWQREK